MSLPFDPPEYADCPDCEEPFEPDPCCPACNNGGDCMKHLPCYRCGGDACLTEMEARAWRAEGVEP